jgi:hypothetical protein
MVPPMLDVYLCQSRIPDDQEILGILLLRSMRPIIGAGNDNLFIQDHDFIVCPCMSLIEGYSYSRPQKKRNGLDRGIMSLRVGVKNDVHLHAPEVSTHKGSGYLLRTPEIGMHEDRPLGPPNAFKDRL